MTSAQVMAPTAVSTWTIDPVHSSAEFSVKHMMISNVKGRFRTFEGTVRLNEERPEDSQVEATIDVASIDTSEPQRDEHLRSADFFAVEQFPKMSFRSKRVELTNDTEAKVIGDLTIRDVTKEVELDVEYEGQIKDAWGKQRAAFTAHAELDRKDFGLNWNKLIDAGGVVIGDKIRVTLNIAAVRNE